MKFQAADRTHADKIIDFQLKMALETEDLQLNEITVKKGVQAVFDDSKKGKYYVVTYENSVIASLLTTYEWSDWRNAKVIWIQSVYVLPEYRNKGIFKLMYAKIKDIVKNSTEFKGIRLYVDKSNMNAQKVYLALGMSNEHYQLFEDML
jgi:ribosomal protein S18 acetylase RimI-like enzyme